MKTKEELEKMNVDELVEYITTREDEMKDINLYYTSRIKRLEEILSAIGIVYDAYKRESNG